jgi:2-polyprenyl-3-methyl-5-hydroxy-6-metoxy-1,4-benzoquinol methylase
MNLADFILGNRLREVDWADCHKAICRPADKGQKRDFYYLTDALKNIEDYADDFGFQWTELYDDYRHDRFKHLDQFMRLGVHPTALRGKTCLDVGCGLGRLSEICLGSADLVFGVDLSDAVTEAARLITTSSFVPIKASGDSIPLVDESIDFVFCWGVLHHTKDPAGTLQDLWRVVKPGGSLAIWVYAKNKIYLKRSLLAHYFSHLDEQEMLEVADVLADTAHALQLTSQSYLSMFVSDLNFSVKNTKEYTRHILYDGLGPDYHYLLDHNWFVEQTMLLPSVASIEKVNSVETCVKLTKR